MNIIITGGCGFIGSNLIKKLIKKNQNKILNIDSLNYASMPESLNDIKNKKNYFFIKNNLQDIKKVKKILKSFNPKIIFHLAAESHVDNSINGPKAFLNSNIIATFNLLESIRTLNYNHKKFRFIHVSTDEVYGSLKNKERKPFNEESKFYPNSPYSATKASSDLLVRAWHKTFKVPTITTNCVNNYGTWQYPEKLIPVVIHSCINKKKIPVYGNGKNIREWIHVSDHNDCLIKIAKKGKIGESYNIGSKYELENLELIKKICKYFDSHLPYKKKYSSLIKFVRDRPAHDYRYALTTKKINKLLNIKKFKNFDKGINETIEWYISNYKWLEKKIEKK